MCYSYCDSFSLSYKDTDTDIDTDFCLLHWCCCILLCTRTIKKVSILTSLIFALSGRNSRDVAGLPMSFWSVKVNELREKGPIPQEIETI